MQNRFLEEFFAFQQLLPLKQTLNQYFSQNVMLLYFYSFLYLTNCDILFVTKLMLMKMYSIIETEIY